MTSSILCPRSFSRALSFSVRYHGEMNPRRNHAVFSLRVITSPPCISPRDTGCTGRVPAGTGTCAPSPGDRSEGSTGLPASFSSYRYVLPEQGLSLLQGKLLRLAPGGEPAPAG